MSKKYCQDNSPRIPKEFKGIQVNCCKFTRCENFGLTPEQAQETELFKEYNKNKLNRQVRISDPYYLIVGGSNGISSIKCRSCEAINANSENNNQVHYIIKSNQAAHEEYERISSYLDRPDSKCINEKCLSHKSEKYNIKKKGTTAKGTQRYQCNDCGKTFIGKPTNRTHEKSELNKLFFKELVGKSPLRQIEFKLEMSMGMIYRRIDFIHNQCMAFVADRERRLYESKSFNRLYLCTDRQVHKSNWTNRKNKKNCEFYGIGTADLGSDYIFAFNFNYDPNMDPEAVEAKAYAISDSKELNHNRKFARVWTKSDFEASKIRMAQRKAKSAGSQEEYIEFKTSEGFADEMSSSENLAKDTDIPVKGMEVHNEYTMIAHFLLLKKLTKNVKKTRFYLDLDSGMKTWYLAAFKEEIQAGNSDGFLVTMEKEMTVDYKRTAVYEAQEKIKNFCGRTYASLTHEQRHRVVNDMIIENIDSPFIPKKSVDAWIRNPMPFMSEPEKMISSFTNIDRYDLEHQANLYRKGSLHSIDRFFMQIRRKVYMFERPTNSGSNKNRVWNGYSPYNPVMYQKLADIFRVFYNYCQPSKKYKQTPAMRLGLAKGPVDIEKILYFEKYK
jgi:transposase-like protein